VTQLEIPLDAVQAAVNVAVETGVRVVLNPAPAGPLDEEILRHVSVLTPNETEAELLTSIEVSTEAAALAAAEKLNALGVQAILITLGSRGAFVLDSRHRELVPSFAVEAMDTTAAGDVFNGALAVALAEGRPLTEAVRFANAAAALAVTKLGARPSAPTREEIESLLRNRP
jgi:ribokinase